MNSCQKNVLVFKMSQNSSFLEDLSVLLILEQEFKQITVLSLSTEQCFQQAQELYGMHILEYKQNSKGGVGCHMDFHVLWKKNSFT